MLEQQNIDRRIAELKAEMPPKRVAFALEYLVDLNQTRAAKRAGYAETAAHVQGNQLLNYPKVSELVELLKRKRDAKTEVTAARVVAELAKMAFGDPKRLGWIVDEEGNKVTPTPEVDEKTKLKALELLGKHTAAFTENLNLTTNGKDLPAAQQVVNVLVNHRRPGQALDPLLE